MAGLWYTEEMATRLGSQAGPGQARDSQESSMMNFEPALVMARGVLRKDYLWCHVENRF